MMGKANFTEDFKRDAAAQITERGYPVGRLDLPAFSDGWNGNDLRNLMRTAFDRWLLAVTGRPIRPVVGGFDDFCVMRTQFAPDARQIG
jgi:hypothetical protein